MPAPSAKRDPVAGSYDPGDLMLQIQELRERVLKLEERLGMAMQEAPEAAAPVPVRAFGLPPDTVPVVGRMLVAIAGAYVLRALTEWGALPAGAGVACGLIYAFVWLWVAARSRMEAGFAAAVNCCTAVLIMAPLLWEASGHLKVMSAAASAGVLAAFALTSLALGTRHRTIALIGGASSIVMAVALLFARDDIAPFTTALLVIAIAMELASWRDLPSGARAVAAVAADFSVLLFSYLMSNPRGMPEAWVPVSRPVALAAEVALALIYIATAVMQTVVRRRTLTFAEIAQTAAALLIGIGGAAWVFTGNRGVMLGLGIAALAGGVACYAVSFLLFERENKRNFRALSTFGLFLVVAGISLSFPRAGFWIFSCICAAACCWTATAFRLPTLGLHGAAYLVLGSTVAGVTIQPLLVLFGSGGSAVKPVTSVAVLLAAVVSWAAVAESSADLPGRWRNQISSLAIAAHIVWITAGLAVYAVLGMWPTVPGYTLGTVVLTGLSLALAWAGTRWRRRELVWLLYGLMAFGGYKLATRDFMNAHNIALVVSLFCYGGALILVPRMLHTGRGSTQINAD